MPDENQTYKLSKALSKAFDDFEERFNKKQKIVGLSTGYVQLDETISGFEPGQLVVLAARPSMGSSLLATNIATNMSLEGCGVGIFTMGNPATHIAERILCSISRVNRMRFRSACVYKDEWPKLASGLSLLQDAPVFINDQRCLNLDMISNEIDLKSNILDRKLALVLIENLEDIEPTERQSKWSKKKFTDHLLSKLKKMAVEKELVVLTLAGLKRRVEKRKVKKPFLFDLKQGASYERYADMILFLYRHGVYEPEKDDGVAQVIIAHHKNGSSGVVKLRFIDEFGVFENEPSESANCERQIDAFQKSE